MRNTGHRWSRLGLLGVLLVVVGACNTDGGDSASTTESTSASVVTAATTTTSAAPSTTEAGKPQGGEVIVASDQEPPTLNSFAPGGDFPIVSLIGNGYWTGVQRVDGFTLELRPEVVTELPSVANGGLVVNDDGTETVKYAIREEATWADGTPISGDDFEFTYETIMDPELPIRRHGYEDIIPDSIIAGPKTFEYTLRAPTLQVELLFGVLIPKHDVAGSNFINDWNDTMWVSGGPFEFDQWRKGEFVRLTRNPTYWKTDPETGQQLPYLDSVIFRFIPDADALINTFEDREVDVINPKPAVQTIERLRRLEAEGALVEVLSGPYWEHLGFQFGENRLVANPKSYNEFLEYRQAVAHAIDKDGLVRDLFNDLVAPIDSYVDGYSPTLAQGSWDQYDYDPVRARELLQALCDRAETDCDAVRLSAVLTASSNNDERVALAEALKPMFAAVGIEYNTRLVDSTLFFGPALDYGEWDLAEWAWIGKPGLASLIAFHDVFSAQMAPPVGFNFYRWGTPAVVDQNPDEFNQGPSSVSGEPIARYAELVALMAATVDADELIGYVNEAEQLLADQAVIIPLYGRLDVGAIWADEVGGYKHNTSDAGDTWNLEEWYRLDR